MSTMNISLPEALKAFVEMEKTGSRISHHPTSGSPRYAVELNLPGLRVMPVPRYAHLVFYVDRGNHIDVWRVLHGERDIPAWLRTAEQP
jgi:toxin ParE1/3/4